MTNSINCMLGVSILTFTGAAVIFFVCYEINMVILNWFTLEQERNIGYVLRELCAIVAGVALVLFALMSILKLILCLTQ